MALVWLKATCSPSSAATGARYRTRISVSATAIRRWRRFAASCWLVRKFRTTKLALARTSRLRWLRRSQNRSPLDADAPEPDK